MAMARRRAILGVLAVTCVVGLKRLPAGVAVRRLTSEAVVRQGRSRWPISTVPLQRRSHMLRANAAAESSGASTEAQTADLIRFIVPTLAALLSSEVMSVVDTAVVGSCSATELAALGPATMLVDSSAYLFFWLNVATTSLFATALAAGDQNEAFSTLSDALYVALLCGLGVSVFIACLGPATLQLICASALEVVPAATRYLRIRMFGYPAFLVGLVLQAACLGAKDSLSPLLVLLVCGALNLGLDLVLVRSCGMGIGGAAIATLAAQLLQTALLAYVVQRKKRRGVAAAAAVATSASPVLASQGPQWLLLRGRPSLPRIRTFLAFAGPMALVLMGKIACYNSMTCADRWASNPSHPTLHTLPFTHLPSVGRALSGANLDPRTEYALAHSERAHVRFEPSQWPPLRASRRLPRTRCSTPSSLLAASTETRSHRRARRSCQHASPVARPLVSKGPDPPPRRRRPCSLLPLRGG